MDFARKQLEKYGWTEGRGLGKNEDGLKSALKPKLKFDKSGVGHDMSKEFTNNWWETLYNNAANNIDVNNVDNEIKMKPKTNDSIEISTKDPSEMKTSQKKLEYGSFIKVSKLTENGTVDYEPDSENSPELSPVVRPKTLMDDELFAACGGRTAHKGARHGLKQNGKLSRIEKQERMLLKKLKNVYLTDSNEIEKKIKKLNKHKNKTHCKELDEMKSTDDVDSSSSHVNVAAAKKKHKRNRHKRVSFNSTVTEYHTQDLDTSSHSAESEPSPKKEADLVVVTTPIKQENEDNNNDNERLSSPPPESATDACGQDEGIEQDIDENSNDNDKDLGHKSFEEAQNTEFMSKEEKKLLKKKRKLERKNRATLKFLEEINKEEINEQNLSNAHEYCGKCKRRKLLEVYSDDNEDMDMADKNNDNESVEKWRKSKKKKRKERKRTEKQLNSIVQSLNQKCKISDTE